MSTCRPPRPRRPVAVVVVAVLVGAAVATLVLLLGRPAADTAPAGSAPAQAAADDREAAVETAPARRLPPRPVEVDVVQDPPDGEVAFLQELAWMALAPDTDGQPELHLVSGADQRLDLTIEVLPVRADELGAPAPHDPDDDEIAPSPLPSADGWVTLAEPRVVLDPDERATMRPTVTVPDDATPGPYLASLRARASTDGGTAVEVSTLLVVDVGDPDAAPTAARPRLDVDLVQRGTAATIRLRLAGGQAVTAVTGHLEVHGWWGAQVATVDLPPVVVLPTTDRVRELAVHPPLAPGRYTVTAFLETRDGDPLEASGAGWLWNRDAASVVAVVLLVLASLALLRARRQHRTRARPPTGGAPDDP